MDNYGGEIGHKMRSAVKAKLVELGSGQAGYIDDELPDYVMIMVANKRSKQQMCTDLNLFLGEQTELFVTWLHEVLHKLEEVTLPVATSSSKKQKRTSSKDRDAGSGGKKERKSSKKEARIVNDSNALTALENSVAGPGFNSINEVFAEELLEKAKKNQEFDIAAKKEIKKKKPRRISITAVFDTVSPPRSVDTDDFDIPTISEISSTPDQQKKDEENAKNQTNLTSREKDLAELAMIQKQIEAAKKILKAKGELPSELLEDDNFELQQQLQGQEKDQETNKDRESVDRDFLNLKDDGTNDFSEGSNEEVEMNNISNLNKSKSPIVFDLSAEKSQSDGSPVAGDQQENASVHRKRMNSEELDAEDQSKRSIHDRLGMKNARPSRNRKEQELYVPAHRRKELDSSKSRERERSRSPNRAAKDASPTRRSRERTRNTSGSRRNYSPERRSARTPRKQSRSPDMERRRTSTSPEMVRKRIGSRVFVAPSKKVECSDDEDLQDKSLNSVIKIKPRSKISPSKQACTNLLLKAVADAQRSTILSIRPKEKVSATERLGRKPTQPIYTKSLKNRLDPHESTSELFRKAKKNLLIEVEGQKPGRAVNQKHFEILADNKDRVLDPDEEDFEHPDVDDVEYVDFETKTETTQFVVTLNDEKARSKLGKRPISSRSSSRSPLPSMSNNKKNLNLSPSQRNHRSDVRSRLSQKKIKEEDSSTANPFSRKKTDFIEVYRKPKEVEKIIIKADTDEEDEHLHKFSNSRTRTKSPLDLDKVKSSKVSGEGKNKRNDLDDERSTTPPLPPSLAHHLTNSKATEKKKKEEVTSMETTSISPKKRKHEPIKFDLDSKKESKESQKENMISPAKKSRRSDSLDRSHNHSHSRRDSSLERRNEERRKISIRKAEDKKYENLPSSLNSVPVDTSSLKPFKTKERCIYHPNCTKNICEYYHPSAPCKAFPNCKFGDKCLYTHPKCKFDQACVNADCNFMHTLPRNLPAAPPLSSHVVPVQSYKSISATTATSTAGVMCKYYPNCTKTGCSFYHPKLCRYGKNCINKIECIFFHPENQSCNKFKWVAQTG